MVKDKKKVEQEVKGKNPKKTEKQTAEESDLLAAKEEISSYIDRLKRLQAEFENYKRRIKRESATQEEKIADRVIRDFLPLYDNMERAFSNFNGNRDMSALVEGMEKIFAQFDQLLRQKGVDRIKAVGELFDPAKHEALLSVVSDREKNLILEEFERGYLRNGRVLRPSKVKVSKEKIINRDNKEDR